MSLLACRPLVGLSRHVSLAFLISCMLLVELASAQVAFDASPCIWQPTNRRPRILVPGDFNGDGHMDLAGAASRRMVIWLNDGLDRYVATSVFFPIDLVLGLATGDLDGDGRLDVVAGTSGSSSNPIYVYWNDGDGEFSADEVPNGPDLRAIDIGDLDGDGHLDIVAGSSSDSAVRWIRGTGTRTLAPVEVIELVSKTHGDVRIVPDVTGDGLPDLLTSGGLTSVYPGDGAGGVAVDPVPWSGTVTSLDFADLDADGSADVLVSGGGGISVLLGEGDGSFEDPQSYPGLDGEGFFVVDDFDGDGNLDAVKTHRDGAELYAGDGSGGLLPSVDLGFMIGDAWDIDSADFDGDGHRDLVITNHGSEFGVSVWLGDGTGSFTESDTISTGRTWWRCVAAHIDDDLAPDFAFSGRVGTEQRLWVALGDGTGGFPTVIPQPIGIADLFAFADLDDDGRTDLVVLDIRNALAIVSVRLGDGTGHFAEVAAVEMGPEGWSNTELGIADINTDGHVDIVVLRQSPIGRGGYKTLRTLLGNGDGSFVTGESMYLPQAARQVDLVDLDGDGVLDLGIGAGDAITVYRGHGDGTFDSMIQQFPGGDRLALADFDGDGRLDIANGERQTLLRGLPGGGFELVSSGLSASPKVEFCAADFDLDGHVDLAYMREDRIGGIQYGDGSFGFDRVVEVEMQDDILDVQCADFTHDGVPDLLLEVLGGDTCVVPSDGAGGLAGGVVTPRGAVTSFVESADLTGDGRLDLVSGGSELAVEVSNGDGSFSAGSRVPFQSGSAIGFGDFDEDGRLDCVAVSQFRGVGPRVYFGDGAGGLSAGPVLLESEEHVSLAVADFDLDGHLDFAVSNANAGHISVLFGDGSGSFPSVVEIDSLYEPHEILAGSFDDLHDPDGLPDLVVEDKGQRAVMMIRNLGARSFVVSSGFEVLDDEESLIAEDMNDDGFLDLVTLRSTVFRTRFNSGYGTFPTQSENDVPRPSKRLMPHDFDGDGFTDLAALDEDGPAPGSWSIVFGYGAANYPARVHFTGEPLEAASATIGDFNGDGRADVAFVTADGIHAYLDTSVGPERCRASLVNTGNGSLRVDVLRVNGSAGQTPDRVVTLDATEPLRVTLERAPNPAAGSRYYAAILDQLPTEDTVRRLPRNAGFGCFTPIITNPAYVTPLHVANTLAPSNPQVDPPTDAATGDPLPGPILDLPAGSLAPGTELSIYAIVGDQNTRATSPVSLTNTVVVRVE